MVTPKRWWERRTRAIVKRLVVTGILELATPAHLGNGDDGSIVDLPLLVDEISGRPVAQGTSLAGALRAYLQSVEYGERSRRVPSAASFTVQLFGGVPQDPNGMQSPLIVDDSLAEVAIPGIRDGVRIAACSRTAADGARYDFEVWPPGTRFPLRVELLVTEGADEDALRGALGTALHGFTDPDGSIHLGARKRRGYGRVTVPEPWTLIEYDLADPRQLVAWIATGHDGLSAIGGATRSQECDPVALLGGKTVPDRRWSFSVSLPATVSEALMIRESDRVDVGPDAVHLRASSSGAGKDQPVLSGTSAGGVLRARARAIARTLTANHSVADELVDSMFGARGVKGRDVWASRVVVEEVPVRKGIRDLVQRRIALDPFTQAPAAHLLFAEQPLFANPDTAVTLELRLVRPRPYEVGLLLLVLKDLWLEDVVVGGEGSIGRGRLRGPRDEQAQEAVLCWRAARCRKEIRLATGQDEEVRVSGDRLVPKMEQLVDSLYLYLTHRCPPETVIRSLPVGDPGR